MLSVSNLVLLVRFLLFLVVSTADKIVIPIGTLGKVYMSNEGLYYSNLVQ